MSSMHTEQMTSRYTPTSPLSPKLSANARPLSPSPQRPRHHHQRQSSRSLHMTLPKYHPSNFLSMDGSPSSGSPSGATQHQLGSMERGTPSIKLDSPRVMREKQRELIERAKLSSKLAASPYVSKPDAPRLDPLGSPSGPVTPLALEEVKDYFTAVTLGGRPAISPGQRLYGRDYVLGPDEIKTKKSWKDAGYP